MQGRDLLCHVAEAMNKESGSGAGSVLVLARLDEATRWQQRGSTIHRHI